MTAFASGATTSNNDIAMNNGIGGEVVQIEAGLSVARSFASQNSEEHCL